MISGLAAFGVVEFEVLTNDGRLPLPAFNDDRIKAYSAEIRLRSWGQLSDLEALLSQVTVLPAAGLIGGGTVQVEAGVGSRVLTWPYGPGLERQSNAVLVRLTPQAHTSRIDAFRVEADFLLLDDA